MSEFEESSEETPPKSPITQHLTKIIAGVLVLVVGFFAYTFMSSDSAPVVTDAAAPVMQNNNAAEQEAKQKQIAEENERKRLENEAKARLEKEAQEKRLLAQAEAQRLEAETKAQALKREQEMREQAQRNLEQQQADRKAAVEEARRQAAVRKLTRLKSLLESDLEKFKNELAKVDGEISRQMEIITQMESAQQGMIAAKNQMAYTEKKMEEVNIQLREYQRRPGTSQELIAQLNRKMDSLRTEMQRFEAAAEKAQQDKVALGRANQFIADQMTRRKNLLRIIGEKSMEMQQLRRDPDFGEMAKLGADVDIQKAIDQAAVLLASLPPNDPKYQGAAKAAPAPTPSPVAPSDSSVTVTTQKTKVTVYTLKDGKTVSATKSVDAGEMLSVKTLDGKFQSIFKEDIVKEEVKEQ